MKTVKMIPLTSPIERGIRPAGRKKLLQARVCHKETNHFSSFSLMISINF
jgi:hypothetical protein